MIYDLRFTIPEISSGQNEFAQTRRKFSIINHQS